MFEDPRSIPPRANLPIRQAARLVAKALLRMRKVDASAAFRTWDAARRSAKALGFARETRRGDVRRACGKALRLFRHASLRAVNGRWRGWLSADFEYLGQEEAGPALLLLAGSIPGER